MSDRVITGIRLLRAVFEAQRKLDRLPRSDVGPKWFSAKFALGDAKRTLAEFEASTEEDWQSKDWKLKQSGER